MPVFVHHRKRVRLWCDRPLVLRLQPREPPYELALTVPFDPGNADNLPARTTRLTPRSALPTPSPRTTITGSPSVLARRAIGATVSVPMIASARLRTSSVRRTSRVSTINPRA